MSADVRYGRTWAIRLPWDKPPLSMNDRPRNWAVHARTIAAVRTLAAREVAAVVDGARCERIDVTLTYYPKAKRRADRINICATQKPCVDALVDIGLIRDDTPEYLVDRLPVIAAPDGDPRIVLTIRELLS